MTLLLLIRHGSTDAVGKILAGRATGHELNALGVAEARALGSMLKSAELRAIYSSPLERALTTAEHIAAPHDTPVQVREALTDIDFGAWNGRRVSALIETDEFRLFNGHRSIACIPEGERVIDVQARMVQALLEIRSAHRNGTVAVVGHADPIRFALAYFLGLSIDHAHRLEVSPGSLAGLELSDHDARLLFSNASPGRAVI